MPLQVWGVDVICMSSLFFICWYYLQTASALVFVPYWGTLGTYLKYFSLLTLNIDLLWLLDSAEFINVLQPYSFSNDPGNTNRGIYHLYSFIFSLFSIAAEVHHLKVFCFPPLPLLLSHKMPRLCSEVLALAAKFLLFNSEIICIDVYKYLLLKWSLF